MMSDSLSDQTGFLTFARVIDLNEQEKTIMLLCKEIADCLFELVIL